MSLNNSILILPDGISPIVTSKKTTEFPLEIASLMTGSMIIFNEEKNKKGAIKCLKRTKDKFYCF